MGNLKKNILYQSCYRLLTVFTPLITAPYLSRVLGPSNLGVYSYSLSITNYFIMIAALGTETYGSRTIARVKTHNNGQELSKTFWEIYITQLVVALFAILVYLITIRNIVSENKMVFYIQVGWIVSTMLDINWFFFGIEEVRYTVVGNSVVKIVGIILILLLVKGKYALLIYTIIMAFAAVISQIILWMYLPRYIGTVKIKFADVSKHIIPNLKLFIPLIGSNVYWTMDKTMLGIFSDYANTGYYYNADKVMNIPLSLVIGIGTVMLPRMSSLIEQADYKDYENIKNIMLEFYICASAAIGGGIAAVSQEFVPLFFGEGYYPCVNLIICFGPILILKAINDFLKSQYVVPLGHELIYTKSVFMGAFVNFCSNILFIPKYGAMGALIATGFSEIVVLIMLCLLEKNKMHICSPMITSIYYLISGIIMFGVIRKIRCFLPKSNVIAIFIEIIFGIFIYSALVVLYWKINKRSRLAGFFIDKKAK